MGKSKRNCRRTEDEILIHEKAVKMRKMTENSWCIMWRIVWQKRTAKDLTAEKHLPGKEPESKSLLITSNLRRFRELEL